MALLPVRYCADSGSKRHQQRKMYPGYLSCVLYGGRTASMFLTLSMVLPDVLQVAPLIVESPLALITLELGLGCSF